ncbi:hypothetical protein Tco_1063146 [Tanacetum coccineum]
MKTSNNLRVLRIILVILPEHQSDTKVFTMIMEILPEPTSNKLCGRKIVTYWFTLTVLSALRCSGDPDVGRRLVEIHLIWAQFGKKMDKMKIQDQALETPSEYSRTRLDLSGTPSKSWRQRMDQPSSLKIQRNPSLMTV